MVKLYVMPRELGALLINGGEFWSPSVDQLHTNVLLDRLRDVSLGGREQGTKVGHVEQRLPHQFLRVRNLVCLVMNKSGLADWASRLGRAMGFGQPLHGYVVIRVDGKCLGAVDTRKSST